MGKEKKMIKKNWLIAMSAVVFLHLRCQRQEDHIQGHPQLYSKFRDSLGHMRPYFKKPERVYNEVYQGSLLWSFLGLQVQDVSS